MAIDQEQIKSCYNGVGEEIYRAGMALHEKYEAMNTDSITFQYMVTQKDVHDCFLMMAEKKLLFKLLCGAMVVVSVFYFYRFFLQTKSYTDLEFAVLFLLLGVIAYILPRAKSVIASFVQKGQRSKRFMTIGNHSVYSSDGVGYFKFVLGEDPVTIQKLGRFYVMQDASKKVYSIPLRDLTEYEQHRVEGFFDAINCKAGG